jgi:hypothetical protein
MYHPHMPSALNGEISVSTKMLPSFLKSEGLGILPLGSQVIPRCDSSWAANWFVGLLMIKYLRFYQLQGWRWLQRVFMLFTKQESFECLSRALRMQWWVRQMKSLLWCNWSSRTLEYVSSSMQHQHSAGVPGVLVYSLSRTKSQPRNDREDKHLVTHTLNCLFSPMALFPCSKTSALVH